MLKALIKEINYGANVETNGKEWAALGRELRKQSRFQIEVVVELVTGKQLKKLFKLNELKSDVREGDSVSIELVGHGFKIKR